MLTLGEPGRRVDGNCLLFLQLLSKSKISSKQFNFFKKPTVNTWALSQALISLVWWPQSQGGKVGVSVLRQGVGNPEVLSA